MSKGFTLWFTGLAGSGKTTLAEEVEGVLLERGLKVEMLDDEEVRRVFGGDLGFSREDYDANAQRIAYVCKLLTRNDMVAIAASVSPSGDVREEIRNQIGRFVEVHCKRSLDALETRDEKGLYARARTGEIKNFPGVSAPYDEPEKPEIVAATDKETVEESAARVVRTLELMGFVPESGESAEYTAEEEAEISRRLKDLGYI